MAKHTAIWKVAPQPQILTESSLANEKLLEDMIVADPRLISDELMLIGRQEDTGTGGRIDLLAIEPDGSLVLIELKRNRTSREVVAQALEYASWVMKLRAEDINTIYRRFIPGGDLAKDFRHRYGQDLDEESLNQSHQIIIVAASLDESTERIVHYLSDWAIPINVMCFQVFAHDSGQLLSRTWLRDPVDEQFSPDKIPNGPSEPWNGEFYVSFGHDRIRSWAEAKEYGFVSGGGGSWYSRTLKLLNPGDRVWANVPGVGFVGVGKVIGRVQPASRFQITTDKGQEPVLDILKEGTYHREFINDPEQCEYFVPVQWLQTVPLENAFKEIGFFGIQHTVCKPTAPKWRYTVERLKDRFPQYENDYKS